MAANGAHRRLVRSGFRLPDEAEEGPAGVRASRSTSPVEGPRSVDIFTFPKVAEQHSYQAVRSGRPCRSPCDEPAGATLRIALVLDRPRHGCPPRPGARSFFQASCARSRRRASHRPTDASACRSPPQGSSAASPPTHPCRHTSSATCRKSHRSHRIAARLRRREPGLVLFQNADNLFVRKSRSLHCLSPHPRNRLTSKRAQFRGARH